MSSSSCREMLVKSRNERNPYDQLLTGEAEDSDETAGDNSRKVGTTSNHHAPYDLGYKRATMAATKRGETVKLADLKKAVPVRIVGLQPAHMKLELLVIADQHAAVNTFPGLVHTARHTMELGAPEVSEITARGQLPKVRPMTGVKS